MPAVRTKHALKMQQLAEGEKTLLDLSIFLHDVLEKVLVELDDSSK